MENATKALLIAAGVLIGIMIISLGVVLYYSLQGYVAETQQTMEENAISKFNTQFLKYINMTEDSSGAIILNGKKYNMDFRLRLQDVITAANIAYENNKQLGLEEGQTADANENNLYVRVNAKINGTTQVNSIEKDINEKASEWLQQDNDYEYKCTDIDVKISEKTGRVYEITFK